jgi:starvation-inducible DNA-binding protein
MTMTQAHTETTGQAQKAAGPLQETLVELLDLTLKAKHAHWNVTGPNFRPVHLQLDDITNDLRVWSDTVAERIVTLGGWARGQAQTVVQSSIEALPDGEPIPDRTVLGWFAERLTGATERARQRADSLGEVDLVSQNILLEIIEGLEKHTWMLRAQLR